jgi:hypothetical protein
MCSDILDFLDVFEQLYYFLGDLSILFFDCLFIAEKHLYRYQIAFETGARYFYGYTV